MTYPEPSPDISLVQPSPAEALTVPPQPTAEPPHSPAAEIMPPVAPGAEREVPTARTDRRLGRRLAAGAVLAGALFLVGGGHHEAAAATTDLPSASEQGQPQGPGNDWTSDIALGTTLVTLGLGIKTVRNQTKAVERQTQEKIDERLNDALKALGDLTDKSSADQRGNRLKALNAYAEDSRYALQIFERVATYLRNRRTAVTDLQKEVLRELLPELPEAELSEDKLTDDQKKKLDRRLDEAMTPRRNPDRNARDLLLATLPAAREKEAEKAREKARRERRRAAGKSGATEEEERFDKLHQLTGVKPDVGTPLVDVKGINWDYGRDVEGANLSDLDLSGAGLRGDQLSGVLFTNSRLHEAQLRGTIATGCDFGGADLRGAYLDGATLERCVVTPETMMGNVPAGHHKSTYGALKPENQDEHRGNPRVILKDLIIEGAESPDAVAELVKQWQRNGLELLGGSNHEYFLDPNNDPNYHPGLW